MIRGLWPCLVLLLLAGPAVAQVPDLIEGDDPAVLTWVSLLRAAPDGRVDWSLFSESSRQSLERTIAAARTAELESASTQSRTTQGCAIESLSPHAYFGEVAPSRSASDYAESGYLVVEGIVTGGAAGFHRGSLGTAYEVEILRILKARPSNQRRDRLLIFWPSGQARIEDTVICSLGPRGGERPAVASRVLIAIEDPSHLGPEIHPLHDQELFFERADGSTSRPQAYPQEIDLRPFADQIAAILGGSRP